MHSTTPRPANHRIRRIRPLVYLVLLLGVITNFSVSASIAIRGIALFPPTKEPVGWLHPDRASVDVFSSRHGTGWTVLETSRLPVLSFNDTVVTPRLLDYGRISPLLRVVGPVDSRRPLAAGKQGCIQREYRFGWPFRSAWAAVCWRHAPNKLFLFECHFDHVLVLRASGIPEELFESAPAPPPRGYGLPTGVLPVGTVLNALFYSACWLAALSIVRLFRRTLRRRAGLCAYCKYCLDGLPDGTPCPECGRPRA